MNAPTAPRTVPVIALTGGIAAGKSLVADLFIALGAEVVDTDAIAHALTAPGGGAIPSLRAAFGPEVLTAEGALDRPAMRARAFADPVVRRTLEQVLHGPIRAEASARLAAAQSPYALLAIPLYAEAGPRRPPVDRVLVVDCDESLQRARALRRPGLTAEQLEGILAAQASRAERLALADDVIDNSGDLPALEAQVAQLDAAYRRLGEGRPG